MNGKGGLIYNLDGVKAVPYRWPELIAERTTKPDQPVFICEGEKDTDNVRALGLTASCVHGNKDDKWSAEIVAVFRDRDIIILEHKDAPGRKQALNAAKALHDVAKTVRIAPFTDIEKKGGDVSDWIEIDPVNNNAAALVARGLQAPLFDPAAATADEPKKILPGNVSPEDFYAYMPQHSYIFVPSGEMWPASSVNARLPPVQIVPGKFISASAHLDKTRAVEQMTWAPGEPKLIKDRLVTEGGWIEREGCNTFNLYRPPVVASGDANKVEPWLEHIRRIYPDETDHIITWLAQRVQHPHDKINHALVLGGAQGIGKDTLLEPVKAAIGPWNFTETSPQQMLGRFNGFIQSVICRISEARDLGEINRYSFYEHMKAYTAAPPDTLRCDQKNLREYSVFNVLGVILTTNHKTGGIYLPDDDRRHFVAWSALAKEDFDATYFPGLWRWYRDGGIAHVVAYLRMRDLSGFNPKAPPPKTEAWQAIVDSNVAPETAELADVLDRLDNPDVVTLTQITLEAQDSEFVAWLKDRRNIRQIPHRFAEVGYEPVRNTGAGDGLWKVRGRRQAIYAKRELSLNERLRAIGRMRK